MFFAIQCYLKANLAQHAEALRDIKTSWVWLMSLTTPMTLAYLVVVTDRQKVPSALKQKDVLSHTCALNSCSNGKKWLHLHPTQFLIAYEKLRWMCSHFFDIEIRISTCILLQISMQSIYILCVVELEKCTQFNCTIIIIHVVDI